MTQTRRRLLVLAVALLAVVAGCSGAGGDAARDGGDGAEVSGGDGGDLGFERQSGGERMTSTPVATAAGDAAGGGAPADYDAAQFAQRQLILTGEVAVEVDDFEAARSNLTEATEGYGGFVSDTRQDVNRIGNESWTNGVVVLRVPRENFTALYERAIDEGELLDAQRNSQDVTDRLVDVRARLENLRAERDQLRTLYDRANTTEDVLEVQERLSDVQGEIERLEARQQALRERVALSTITVRLREPRPDRPLPEDWYDVPLVAAFTESVNGVVVTLRALAVATAYAVPYVVVFGVPLALVGLVARRRRGSLRPGGLPPRLRRRGGGGGVEAEEPEEPADGDVEEREHDDAEAEQDADGDAEQG